jgi:hypothetical protein
LVAIAACVVLILSGAVKAWSGVRLMSLYRRADYLSTPAARRLFAASKVTPLLMVAAILTLSYCTGLWWVEIPAWFLLAFIVCSVAWIVQGHRSGRYAGG